MNRTRALKMLAACALSFSVSGAALAFDSPTPREVQQAANEVLQWYNGLPAAERSSEGLNTKVGEVFGQLNLEEFSTEALAAIPGWTRNQPSIRDRIAARIDTLARDSGPDGAVAQSLKFDLSLGEEAQRETLEALFTHPGFAKAVTDGRQIAALGLLVHAKEELIASMGKQMTKLANLYTGDLAPQQLRDSVNIIMALNRAGKGVDQSVRDAVRTNIKAKLLAAAEEATDDRAKANFTSQAKFLDGAFARGQLIDHDAPPMYFTWSSGDKGYNSIEDLRGKVVVIDYWATWCGPCISSFPNIKQLVERYKGYDVVVLGVTSLQGSHYTKDRQRIDTTNDPDREYELMNSFMAEYEMTWPVVFSTENVFNPDYGVRGIPHVAIIGPDGKVRFNGMHPAGPLKDKAEKIDKLLKDAGKPVPAPVE